MDEVSISTVSARCVEATGTTNGIVLERQGGSEVHNEAGVADLAGAGRLRRRLVGRSERHTDRGERNPPLATPLPPRANWHSRAPRVDATPGLSRNPCARVDTTQTLERRLTLSCGRLSRAQDQPKGVDCCLNRGGAARAAVVPRADLSQSHERPPARSCPWSRTARRGPRPRSRPLWRLEWPERGHASHGPW